MMARLVLINVLLLFGLSVFGQLKVKKADAMIHDFYYGKDQKLKIEFRRPLSKLIRQMDCDENPISFQVNYYYNNLGQFKNISFSDTTPKKVKSLIRQVTNLEVENEMSQSNYYRQVIYLFNGNCQGVTLTPSQLFQKMNELCHLKITPLSIYMTHTY